MKVKEIKQLLSQTDNPALLFNKLLLFKYAEQISKGQEIKKKDYIGSFLESLRGKGVLKQSRLGGISKESFKLKTAYRLVIGAGYPSFVENGFLFHHIYGIPYIPGETLKGLARFVFMLSIAESLKEEVKLSKLEEDLSEEKAIDVVPQKIKILFDDYEIENPVGTFLKIFGSKKRRGQIIFFDAYPVSFNPSRDFEIDIMNPHYGEYYQQNKAPADWLNPTPIHFLALREGIEFEFSLGTAPLEPLREEEESILLETAKRLLEIGLKNFGVGSKKLKGYGWFK